MNEDEKSEHVAWLRYKTRHESLTRIMLCDSDVDGAFPVFRQPHNAELDKLRARIDSAPVAIMDTRDALGICAPTEADFPALYALRGKRVRLVVEDELHAHGDGAKQGMVR